MKIFPGDKWLYRDGSKWIVRPTGILECISSPGVDGGASYKRGYVHAKPELIDVKDGWEVDIPAMMPVLSFEVGSLYRETESGWEEVGGFSSVG